MNQLPLRAVLLTILTTCVAAAAASAEAAGYRGLSEWMQSHIDAKRLVGCSAQVTRDGETVFLEAFGKRSPAAAETLGVDQVVRIYSMSKPITSAAVMQLVEQGALDLDDPVSMYIPEFAAMTVGVGEDAYPARRPITIRDLLTHTSGLTYGFSAPEHLKAAYQAVFKPGTTLAEAAAGMGSLPLLQDVGTGFVYGVNTDVLGRVVEVVSKQPLDAYLEEHVFEPLGMTDTSFAPPADLDLMHIVREEAGTLEIDEAHYTSQEDAALTPPFPSGGGGLWSTLHDYTRFMRAMEQYGTLDGVRILRPETVAFMTQNQLSPAYGTPQRFGLGFGLQAPVQTSQGPRGGGRWTWGGAASTYFFIDPAQDLTAIFITQKFPFDFALSAEFHQVVLEAAATARLASEPSGM